MPLALRTVLLAGIVLLLGAGTLAAQIPGGDIQSPTGWRSQYLAEVYRNVDITLRQWMAAWENDDAPGAAGLFTAEGTYLTAEGEEVRGRARIRDSFACRLPRADGIELKMADFAAGGDLAYQSGRFTYRVGSPADSAALRTGRYVAVLQQEGSRWRIRSLQEYADTRPASVAAAGCPARAAAPAP
ncbi:MAG: nuclear transport factor 2 family protein [Longimicrobiaceae bacterium]